MSIVLFLVFGVINAIIANKKGFNPFIWFFAAGLLGLIVLSLMPSASSVEESDEALYLQRKKAGNTAGLIILGVAAILVVIVLVMSNA